MRVHIQRVESASVTVAGDVTGEIAHGLLLLIAFSREDSDQHFTRMAEKICHMRIFSNADGRFDRSVLDVKGSLLAVPQFTLYADCKKGRRPDFFSAMEPEQASRHFTQFLGVLKEYCPHVESGIFGAHMKVALTNDGPVTILLNSEDLFPAIGTR